MWPLPPRLVGAIVRQGGGNQPSGVFGVCHRGPDNALSKGMCLGRTSQGLKKRPGGRQVYLCGKASQSPRHPGADMLGTAAGGAPFLIKSRRNLSLWLLFCPDLLPPSSEGHRSWTRFMDQVHSAYTFTTSVSMVKQSASLSRSRSFLAFKFLCLGF